MLENAEKKCECCGKEFLVFNPQSYVYRNKHTGAFYCSYKCYKAYRDGVNYQMRMTDVVSDE